MDEYDTLDELAKAAQRITETHLLDLFANDEQRMERLSLKACGLYADFSRQKLDAGVLDLLVRYGEQCGIAQFLSDMYQGKIVNLTENRAASHMSLRAAPKAQTAAIAAVRARMDQMSDDLASGAVSGAEQRRISHIVHIGIGGSDLGPRLVYSALKRSRQSAIQLRFVANIDPAEINDALSGLDPAATLIFVVSKSFTTSETMANARTARNWLQQHLGDQAVSEQMFAISTNQQAANEFGIQSKNIFGFEESVGGRFSLWSAVGVSLVAALGKYSWNQFLAGAEAMDQHLLHTPLENNLPVVSALISFWNLNYLNFAGRAIIPYAGRLGLLPMWMQQLVMESNGKTVMIDGKPATKKATPLVFGDAGTNAQHAFFQALHQGADVVPVDFIGVAKNSEHNPEQHRTLLANMLAQASALMTGHENTQDPHKHFFGDRPSTTLLMDELSPFSLGCLLAYYEHETVVLAHLCKINPFDQWGVELGKKMAGKMYDGLAGKGDQDCDIAAQAMLQQISKVCGK